VSDARPEQSSGAEVARRLSALRDGTPPSKRKGGDRRSKLASILGRPTAGEHGALRGVAAGRVGKALKVAKPMGGSGLKHSHKVLVGQHAVRVRNPVSG
jgi:hypothetical protein